MDTILMTPEVMTKQFEFSVYSAPITNLQPLKTVTLKDVFTVISSEKYKKRTDGFRSLEPGKLKDDFKRNNFDYVTFSCTTSKRDSNSVLDHSNLFCIDLDHIGNVQKINEIKDKISSFLKPALMFRSPSGDGLKVVYQIDINQGTHLEYFLAFESFFEQEFDLKIDDKPKSIVSACFLCHDPEAFYIEEPDTLDRSFIDTFQPQQNTVIQAKSTIKPQQPTSEAIADNTEIIKRVKTWLDKEQVFTKGNRNNYIYEFAKALNRFGVPENISLSELDKYNESDFPSKDIQAIVKSVYNKTQYYNIAKFDINIPCTFAEAVHQEEPEEGQPDTPLLPIEGMPEFIQDFIIEYTRVYNLPRDFIAGSVIISTALGIGNKLELVGKYKNVPVLWINIIGNVSSGKTHPLSECLNFFTERDGSSIKKYKNDLSIFNAEQEKPKKERDFSIIKPDCFQYILQDSTPEASALAHAINDRGICFYRDELKGWIDDFNRYNKSGEQSNMLSSFYQQSITFNRKGSGILNILKPCIFVAGGMQIDLLPTLAQDSRAENGFLSRFCNVFPDNSEKRHYVNESFATEVMEAYHEYLNILVSLPEVVKLQLSNEASVLYQKWFNDNADKTNKEQSGYLKGCFGKLDVICLRLAIVLHGMRHACNNETQPEILPETIKAAIDMTEYFRCTALKVYRKIFKDGDGNINKKGVAKYLLSLGNHKTIIADVLKTSRSQIDRLFK